MGASRPRSRGGASPPLQVGPVMCLSAKTPQRAPRRRLCAMAWHSLRGGAAASGRPRKGPRQASSAPARPRRPSHAARRPRLGTCGLMPGGIGQSAGAVSQARPAAMPARWGVAIQAGPHKPSAPLVALVGGPLGLSSRPPAGLQAAQVRRLPGGIPSAGGYAAAPRVRKPVPCAAGRHRGGLSVKPAQSRAARDRGPLPSRPRICPRAKARAHAGGPAVEGKAGPQRVWPRIERRESRGQVASLRRHGAASAALRPPVRRGRAASITPWFATAGPAVTTCLKRAYRRLAPRAGGRGTIKGERETLRPSKDHAP